VLIIVRPKKRLLRQLAEYFYRRCPHCTMPSALPSAGQTTRPAAARAAHEALRHAKQRAYAEKQPCIDYHSFIKEGMPGMPFGRWRDEISAIPADRSPRSTGRPYTLDEMEKLQQSLAALDSFPRSQLYAICQELKKGMIQGSLFYDYQRARLSRTNAQDMARSSLSGADPTRRGRVALAPTPRQRLHHLTRMVDWL
jgi:hypothetical protein